MSEGNGHPYSWSAIFNGYEPAVMAECPFPVIPDYLSRQEFPRDAIPGAKVTHVWTQDRRISEHVAVAARIAHVVDRLEDMATEVDAILLARDDAETHAAFAAPFLEAGLPLYVDKPFALSVAEAQAMYAREKHEGQIFTCSALVFAREFTLSQSELAALGPLRYVEAMTPKDWDKYAVHVIEPLLNLLQDQGPATARRAGESSIARLDLSWSSGLRGQVAALGSSYGPLCIRLFGEKGWRELRFVDSFSCFKAALARFVDIVRGDAPPQDHGRVLEVIRLIEAGRR
jgi:hypothetical protein